MYGGICQSTANSAATPGCAAAVLPCSLSCDKRWVYFSQVKTVPLCYFQYHLNAQQRGRADVV